MKKTISFVIAFLMTLGVSFKTAYALGDSAEAAILYERNTDTVLFEKNIHEHMLIASTTKIMTAMIVLDNCSVFDTVIVDDRSAGIEGSSMYLESGAEYSVFELLCGLMLASGNDAAVALAYHVCGSIDGFAELMNEKAAALGCADTSFSNPNGLDAEGHYSSAYDLALITDEALKDPVFRNIVSTQSITIGEKTYTNHNKLLWQYEGATGVKTGYTISAGRTLVS